MCQKCEDAIQAAVAGGMTRDEATCWLWENTAFPFSHPTDEQIAELATGKPHWTTPEEFEAEYTAAMETNPEWVLEQYKKLKAERLQVRALFVEELDKTRETIKELEETRNQLQADLQKVCEKQDRLSKLFWRIRWETAGGGKGSMAFLTVEAAREYFHLPHFREDKMNIRLLKVYKYKKAKKTT